MMTIFEAGVARWSRVGVAVKERGGWEAIFQVLFGGRV